MQWFDVVHLIVSIVIGGGVIVSGIYTLIRVHSSNVETDALLNNEVKHLKEKVDKIDERLDKIENKIDGLIEDLLEVSVIRTRKK